MRPWKPFLGAGLIATAALAATAAALGASRWGVIFWVPAGWAVAGLPAVVLGVIAFQGFRDSEKR